MSVPITEWDILYRFLGLFIDAFCNNLESAAAVKTQRVRIPDIGMETQTGPPPADTEADRY